jgi:hypothetical protein
VAVGAADNLREVGRKGRVAGKRGIALLVVSSGLFAACGGHHPDAAARRPTTERTTTARTTPPSSSTTEVSTTTTTGSTTTGSTTTGSTTTTVASGAPVSTIASGCAGGDLALSWAGVSVSTGLVVELYELENRGSAACRLEGVPAISLETAGGASLTISEEPDRAGLVPAESTRVVRLAPGQAAWFLVGFETSPTGGSSGCARSHVVVVEPPGGSGQVRLTAPSGQLEGEEGSSATETCGVIGVTPLLATRPAVS